MALRYIPKKFRTVELCRAAYRQNSQSLRYAPKELQDKIIGSGSFNFNREGENKYAG
jgi:hypothetical protein